MQLRDTEDETAKIIAEIITETKTRDIHFIDIRGTKFSTATQLQIVQHLC